MIRSDKDIAMIKYIREKLIYFQHRSHFKRKLAKMKDFAIFPKGASIPMASTGFVLFAYYLVNNQV